MPKPSSLVCYQNQAALRHYQWLVLSLASSNSDFLHISVCQQTKPII